MSLQQRSVWLDCDPGHDDAIALLLALFAPSATSSTDGTPALNLLGVSTTHGNTSGACTYVNAVKLLSVYGIAPQRCKVWRGADVPLMRPPKFDVGIHGEDGLGGVECLPDISDDLVQQHLRAHLSKSDPPNAPIDFEHLPLADPLGFVTHLLAVLEANVREGRPPISIIATGPLTNVALLIKMCSGSNFDLLRRSVDQIVLMGGAAAVPGNRAPLAEWNILVDPEAASIVFESPLPVVMAGLGVTHQAVFTPELHRRLLLSKSGQERETIEALHKRASPLRRLISSALTFFASTYKSEFGLINPPVHDMLAVAYVIDPTLFYAIDAHGSKKGSRRYAVKVDTSAGLACGATVVDFYNQWNITSQSWAAGGLNAVVLEHVDTQPLWELFFRAVDAAEARGP